MFIPESLRNQNELIRTLQRKLEASERELANQKWVFEQFMRSPSWRLTYPIRWLARQFRRLKNWLIPGIGEKQNLPLARPESTEPSVNDQDAASIEIKELFTSIYRLSFECLLGSGRTLELPQSREPEITIIIVLYNRAELTLACLRSIAENYSEKIEVIIVDNASTDRTHELLSRIRGARIIRNKENLHFLLSVNQAARQARGEYLLLLNNDAQILPGSLRSAIQAIESADDIGAVGGRIMLFDGTLQEAGSIVWRDGSCLGYGRGGNPFAFPYMFRRDVDYCSGAFLLTRRTVWEKLGGFDEIFKPAYYEETDYCLRLWEAGLRVVYEPGAAILHYEFASSKSSKHAIALQAAHQEIFSARHASTLQSHHAPDLNSVLFARIHSKASRILIIDDRVPHGWLGSGFPRARTMLLSLLKRGFFVTMYPMAVFNEDLATVHSDIPPELEIASDLGVGLLNDFLSNRHGYYEAIIVSRPHNMAYLKPILDHHPEWFENTRIIYDAEALFASRDVRFRQLKGETLSSREIDRIYKEEIEITRSADCIVTVSKAEQEAFEKYGAEPVYVLGHTIEASQTPSDFSQRSGFLFVGAIHEEVSPNGDSMIWFLEQIWPVIRLKLGPGATLTIAGLNKSERVMKLADSSVAILGPQDDLTRLYDSARVFIAPTRYSAGIPHKVHEAAARGVPVVATTLLASQLHWQDGIQLSVADDPVSFALKCIELHESEPHWTRIRDEALRTIEQDCSREAFEGALDNILDAETLIIGGKRFADAKL